MFHRGNWVDDQEERKRTSWTRNERPGQRDTQLLGILDFGCFGDRVFGDIARYASRALALMKRDRQSAYLLAMPRKPIAGKCDDPRDG